MRDRGCCLGRFGRIQDTKDSLKARKASEVYYPPLLIHVCTNKIAFGDLEGIKQYDTGRGMMVKDTGAVLRSLASKRDW